MHCTLCSFRALNYSRIMRLMGRQPKRIGTLPRGPVPASAEWLERPSRPLVPSRCRRRRGPSSPTSRRAAGRAGRAAGRTRALSVQVGASLLLTEITGCRKALTFAGIRTSSPKDGDVRPVGTRATLRTPRSHQDMSARSHRRRQLWVMPAVIAALATLTSRSLRALGPAVAS